MRLNDNSSMLGWCYALSLPHKGIGLFYLLAQIYVHVKVGKPLIPAKSTLLGTQVPAKYLAGSP